MIRRGVHLFDELVVAVGVNPEKREMFSLDDRIDPDRRFRNFGFIAGPLHLIEEITNFGPAHKQRLIEAIQARWSNPCP